MNKKIFEKLLLDSQNDPTKITQPYIKETFGVEIKRCDTLEQYTDAIDDACLHKYFSKYWQNDMKKWKYSGLALIDEVNNLKPRVLLSNIPFIYNFKVLPVNFIPVRVIAICVHILKFIVCLIIN